MTPTFRPNSELVRYVSPEFRAKDGRVMPAAYHLRPEEDHLSVNSTEVHTEKQIAAIYKQKFSEPGPLVVHMPTIEQYVEAAAHTGLRLARSSANDTWVYQRDTKDLPAFLHRPKEGNASHCGVEFVKHMTQNEMNKFALRIAYKPRSRSL